jgi:hypothetical protein
MSKYIKQINMKNKSQTFRFCCSCIRMTLLTEDGCYFCSSKFILATKTDDLNIRPKKYAESH